MLCNYVTTAWRSLRRRRAHALIHIAGLAIGLACCLVIAQQVRHELSFDRFHARAERSHRLVATTVTPSQQSRLAIMPGLLAPVVLGTPGVEAVTRVNGPDRALLCRGPDCGYHTGVLAAEPSFFEVFSFPLLRGDARKALAAPNTVVLSEHLARRYFGVGDPLGQRVWLQVMGDTLECTVTGVVADPPTNTELQYDALLSLGTTAAMRGLETWNNWSYYTYVVLAPGASPGPVAASLTQVLQDHWGYTRPAEDHTEVSLQPLREAHLDTRVQYPVGPTTDPRQLWILAGIALAILLIAGANSVNLATALSAARQREIGARTVVGASRGQLVRQLLGESVAASLLATGLAVALVELALPWCQAHLGAPVSVAWDGRTMLGLGAVALVVGVLTGVYPSLVVTRQTPAAVLQGRGRIRSSTGAGRVLLALQFALAIGFASGTVVMAGQYRLFTQQRLGFDQEQVVVVRGDGLGWNQRGRALSLYAGAVRRDAAAVAAARASNTFGRGLWSTTFDYAGGRRTVYQFAVDGEYLRALGLRLVAGRDPTGESRAGQVLVNEALVRQFHLGSAVDEAISGGQRPAAASPGGPAPGATPLVLDFATRGRQPNTVAGVVADYHFGPLHVGVEPLILHSLEADDDMASYVLVRLAPGSLPSALDVLRRQWESLVPHHPFVYSFLDEDLARQYASEQRWLRTVQMAAGLAVVLACVGLVGLTSLAVVQRSREIGIRKALGASVPRVIRLLVSDAAGMAVAGGAVGAPVAYLLLRRWLQDFACRVELGPGVFVVAAAGVLALAVVAAGTQALRGALANPADVLRQE
ncbi:MAG: ABC transporter permease [Candidatus Latescibacterota bacterium]